MMIPTIDNIEEFREAIAAVRAGKANYAQAQEVEAVCVLLARDLAELKSGAHEATRKYRDRVMGQAVAAAERRFSSGQQPRLKFSAHEDRVIWREDQAKQANE